MRKGSEALAITEALLVLMLLNSLKIWSKPKKAILLMLPESILRFYTSERSFGLSRMSSLLSPKTWIGQGLKRLYFLTNWRIPK